MHRRSHSNPSLSSQASQSMHMISEGGIASAMPYGTGKDPDYRPPSEEEIEGAYQAYTRGTADFY